MTRPVELIVAEGIHDVLDRVDHLPPPLRKAYRSGLLDAGQVEAMARLLVCQIAQRADMADVWRALSVTAGIGRPEDLARRIAAAQETRTRTPRGSRDDRPTR